MAKEACVNCSAKMGAPVPFCPTCGRPTRHATEAELLEWDLQQWRAHVDRSVAQASGNGGRSYGAAVAERARSYVPVSAQRAEPAVAPDRPAVARTTSAGSAGNGNHVPAARADITVSRTRRRSLVPRVTMPRIKLPKLRRDEDRVIVLDDANPAFVYKACTSCDRTDWLVRLRRNEDGTWNYWCVRCSRNFKTDLRLRHAVKPFAASGFVLGSLIFLSNFLR